MAKYLVEVLWREEVEAEDEGGALEEAYNKFSFWTDASAELIEDYEDEEN
jgi:hypothetical protein